MGLQWDCINNEIEKGFNLAVERTVEFNGQNSEPFSLLEERLRLVAISHLMNINLKIYIFWISKVSHLFKFTNTFLSNPNLHICLSEKFYIRLDYRLCWEMFKLI